MIGFSVTILVIILITIQHLINWMWRGIYKETEVNLYGIGLGMTVLAGVLTWLIILTIIKLGQPLIQ